MFSIIRPIIISLIALNLISCSAVRTHQQGKFETEISSNDCSKAMEEIPHNNKINKLISKTETNVGKVISYSVIGGALVVDVLWDVGVGTVAVVAMCSPGIVLSAAVGGGMVPIPCVPVGNGIGAAHVSDKARTATARYSCPNIDEISQNIRKVAACYADMKKDKPQAINILYSLKKQDGFFNCLSRAESDRFFEDLERYKAN